MEMAQRQAEVARQNESCLIPFGTYDHTRSVHSNLFALARTALNTRIMRAKECYPSSKVPAISDAPVPGGYDYISGPCDHDNISDYWWPFVHQNWHPFHPPGTRAMDALEARYNTNVRNMEDKNLSSKIRTDVASRLKGYQNALDTRTEYEGARPSIFTISECIRGMSRSRFAAKLQ